MKFIILKLNLVIILLVFESFVKTEIIHKGIQNSEVVEIKKNHTRKLTNDDGGYMKLYYKSDANYSNGFKNDCRIGICRHGNCHKSHIYLFNSNGFSVDGCRPAVFIGNTEKYKFSCIACFDFGSKFVVLEFNGTAGKFFSFVAGIEIFHLSIFMVGKFVIMFENVGIFFSLLFCENH